MSTKAERRRKKRLSRLARRSKRFARRGGWRRLSRAISFILGSSLRAQAEVVNDGEWHLFQNCTYTEGFKIAGRLSGEM